MLNADDPGTIVTLNVLKSTVEAGARPLVVWLGAGASRWVAYPSWKELTLQLRKVFFQSTTNFDNQRALRLLDRQDFPAVFQMCSDLDVGLYNTFLVDTFAPKSDTELYRSFISLLKNMNPLFVVTTNVEEALESRIPRLNVVQRTDLERVITLLQRGESFVAKLHGSVSSAESMVFSTCDYSSVTADPSYLQMLKYIFASCSVIFLGYGVRDEYVIRLLRQNRSEMDLFGAGPHFAVTNSDVAVESVRKIRYNIKLHPDHRAALNVLNFIEQCGYHKPSVSLLPDQQESSQPSPGVAGAVPPGKTAYYISDLMPPGTWETSQDITAQGGPSDIEASFGLGFTNDEVPFTVSTAMTYLLRLRIPSPPDCRTPS